MLASEPRTIFAAVGSLLRLYSSTGERWMPFSSTIGTMTPPMMIRCLRSRVKVGLIRIAAATLVTEPSVQIVISLGFSRTSRTMNSTADSFSACFSGRPSSKMPSPSKPNITASASPSGSPMPA